MIRRIPLLILAAGLAACSSNSKKEKEQASDTTVGPVAFDTSSLDLSYRPQDDFDNFANGNWKKMNPVPETEKSWGAFHVIDKDIKEVKLKGILDEVLKQENKAGSDAQKIADMYKSYMDTNTIESLGLKPLESYMNKIAAVNDVNQWLSTSGELQRIGVNSVIGVYVDADDKNSQMNAVKWVQSGLSLGEKGYYTNTDKHMVNIRNEFVTHIDKYMAACGLDEKDAGKRILKFETNLAKIQMSNVELRDPEKTYNKIASSDLNSYAAPIDYVSFGTAQGVSSDSIIVHSTKYYKDLAAVLNKTPIEDLKLYAHYQLIKNFSGYLGRDLRNETFRFYGQIVGGVKEQKKRDIKAIEVTEDIGGGNILGRIFVSKYFPESSKRKVAEMIENVRAVYKERIENLTWMSAETKEKALQKLSTFTYKIGYPDKWEDYSSISIKPNTLIENILSNIHREHEKMLSDIGKPVDKQRWHMPPQTVNAYYNPLNNEIVFPAGILQAPFFNPNADDAVNYGGIIAVIGHEFTHGFDDQGAKFDSEGNLKNWWKDEDTANFSQLSNRYIRYFDQFEVMPDVHINGSLTIGENIADLGGLTLAYYALKKSLEGKPEPAKIDGFTWQQRFFLSWAQVWHNNITEEALRNKIQEDPHSPARYRINGPLKHLTEFYEAWDVKEGDKMWLPAEQRISIW